MNQQQQLWSNRVTLLAALFAGFGAAHLIDDFIYGVPTEVGLPNDLTQVLALTFFVALTGLTALAARGSRQSYLGFITIGTLLALAELLKHIPEIKAVSSYRSGFWSVAFVWGVFFTGVAVALTAWRARQAISEP